jgi:hypothetical protein
MNTITNPAATTYLAMDHGIMPHRCEDCGTTTDGFITLSDGDPKSVLYQCRRCGGMSIRSRRWVLDRIRRQG